MQKLERCCGRSAINSRPLPASWSRCIRDLAATRRYRPGRIVFEHLRHLFVDALEAMPWAGRRVHIALADPAPQKFAGPGVRDVDGQRANDDRFEVVRTVAVIAPVTISPTGPAPGFVLRLKAPAGGDVNVRVYVVTLQASRLELPGDRLVGVLPHNRTVVRGRLVRRG